LVQKLSVVLQKRNSVSYLVTFLSDKSTVAVINTLFNCVLVGEK